MVFLCFGLFGTAVRRDIQEAIQTIVNLSEYDRLMREYDWGNLPQKSQTMCEQLKFRVQSLYIHVDFVP